MIKIHINSIEHQEEVNELLKSRDLTSLINCSNEFTDDLVIQLLIDNDKISMLPDWSNQRLPLLFPSVSYTPQNLIAYICLVSELWQEARDSSDDESLSAWVEGLFEGPEAFSSLLNSELSQINRFLLAIYAESESRAQVPSLYKSIITQVESPELKAFVTYHYSAFLEEVKVPNEVLMALLVHARNEGLSLQAQMSLKLQFVSLMMTSHAEGELIGLDELKVIIAEVYDYLKGINAPFQLASVLELMSQISINDEHYSEALGYLNAAIDQYKHLELPELVAQVNLDKASLLHLWAKKGFPQFFTKAIESYQEALRVHKKLNSPEVFAQIHHQLGVLYSELPSMEEKKKIWSALSATSFKEALEFFSKEKYPLIYASVCHNYATAIMNYPEAAQSDNIEKAINFFLDALAIRKEAPYEYSLTALNLLEAYWEANNVNQVMERIRRREMRQLAEEIIQMNASEEMVLRAKEHLEALKETYKPKEVTNA